MKRFSYLSILVNGFIFGQACSSDIVITTSNYAVSLTQSNTYIAINSSVDPNNIIKLDADPNNGYVQMNPGFIALPNSYGAFVAQALDGCGNAIPQKIINTIPSDASQEKITISPNPVDGLVNICFEKNNTLYSYILLYDESGKLVLNKALMEGNKVYSINISNLVSGSYIYKIMSHKNVITGIILKK